MNYRNAKSFLLSGVSAAALLLAAGPAGAQTLPRYASGDFHNHTTCTDGVVSTQTMIRTSIEQYGLEWLVNAGHGGAAARDCRLNDPGVDETVSRSNYLYADRIPDSAFKGDRTTTSRDGRVVRQMWRWQNIQEFEYPIVIEERTRAAKNIFTGLEQVVPGHEHSSVTIINGQAPRRGGIGNATPVAQFEYLFDRADNDTSGGAGQGWTGKISNVGLVGQAAHDKSVAGITWMQTNYPLTSYNIPAHLERPGVFSTTGNGGWNIEHLRDWNNAGPTVSFGFESQPGHQAEEGRGSYTTNAAGGGTFGGTGLYAAKIGGVWDGLLGEGRNWFFFASSDWHSRGSFSPFERRSDADFYPGENQRQYIPFAAIGTPQGIVDALRKGDAYSVQADLIANDMSFQVCEANACTTRTAGMGSTLVVPPGSDVTVTLSFTQPTAVNYSPYSFNNPLLTPLGINQPLDRPIVDHVDIIRGNVTGVVAPGTAAVVGATLPSGDRLVTGYGFPAGTTRTAASVGTLVYNPSTVIAATFNGTTNPWTVSGQRRTMTYTVRNVTAPLYVRARGTNLPAGTPFATDAAGNPLLDFVTSANAPCTDPACPSHMPIVNGERRVSFDVRGWGNVWFYTNPIFIRPDTSAPLLAETNNNLARRLAGQPPQ
ncbi:MAG: hypothetical protein H7Z10_15745 [Gemmatimonadaceae bacterium]|nr:hypothetical protein [Acetobacteraceae bacterium]